MPSSPDLPIGESDPYLYLDEDRAPDVWNKCPRTLRDALLLGPPIGETGPYLYLHEYEARNVWGTWPHTRRDGPAIGEMGPYLYLD